MISSYHKLTVGQIANQNSNYGAIFQNLLTLEELEAKVITTHLKTKSCVYATKIIFLPDFSVSSWFATSISKNS